MRALGALTLIGWILMAPDARGSFGSAAACEAAATSWQRQARDGARWVAQQRQAAQGAAGPVDRALLAAGRPPGRGARGPSPRRPMCGAVMTGEDLFFYATINAESESRIWPELSAEEKMIWETPPPATQPPRAR
jgi:hypothetical protein